MGLAPRLLGAQAAPGRSMGSAWLGSRPARRLGSRRRLLALSPNFGIFEQARTALTGWFSGEARGLVHFQLPLWRVGISPVAGVR
jgi:hypothetical protein